MGGEQEIRGQVSLQWASGGRENGHSRRASSHVAISGTPWRPPDDSSFNFDDPWDWEVGGNLMLCLAKY